MKRVAIVAHGLAILILSGAANAVTRQDVDHLIPPLIAAESSGRDTVVRTGGSDAGCLQITPIMLKDVNRIAGGGFTSADRFNRDKSIQMCHIWMNYYGKRWTIEEAVRFWNNGPNNRKYGSGNNKHWMHFKREYARIYGRQFQG